MTLNPTGRTTAHEDQTHETPALGGGLDGRAGGRANTILGTEPASLPDPAELAERHYVGAVLHMTRPADVCGAADLVPVGWINDPHIRQVYRVAVLEATQGRVDTSALPAVMMRHGLPSTAVGIYTGLVVDLLSGVPLPENWRGYASTIIDTRLRQEVAEIGRRLAHEAQQLGHAELVALTDQAADQVRQLSDRLLALHGRPA